MQVLKPCLWALGAALAVTAVAGFQRIWSQFSAGPIELLWPFARPLAAAAIETGFLIGIPVGLAAAAFVVLPRPAPGSFRASFLSFARAALPVALALCTVSVLMALVADPGTSRPGRLAGQLVEQGRQGCLEPGAPTEIAVPLVNVRWQCTAKGPRVIGTAPIGRSASFSAAEIHLNADLSRIRLRDLSLEAGATPRLRVRAADATISGLRPWGRPQKMPAPVRGFALALCALAAALLVALIVLGMDAPSRFEPWLTGVLVAMALWLTLSTLDRGDLGLTAYGLLPISAAVAALAGGVLSRVAKRVARRRVRC